MGKCEFCLLVGTNVYNPNSFKNRSKSLSLSTNHPLHKLCEPTNRSQQPNQFTKTQPNYKLGRKPNPAFGSIKFNKTGSLPIRSNLSPLSKPEKKKTHSGLRLYFLLHLQRATSHIE